MLSVAGAQAVDARRENHGTGPRFRLRYQWSFTIRGYRLRHGKWIRPV